MAAGQPDEFRRLWTTLWIVWKSGRWWTLRVRRERPGWLNDVRGEDLRRVREQLGLDLPAFTCPVCGMTSHNPDDVRAGYCGNCHDWTRERNGAR